MKKLVILCSAAALVVGLVAQPQGAEARGLSRAQQQQVLMNQMLLNQGNYGYNGYSPYGYGYGSGYVNYGGATVFPDGSFSNNGYSWNGADPTGGATGIRNGWARSRNFGRSIRFRGF